MVSSGDSFVRGFPDSQVKSANANGSGFLSSVAAGATGVGAPGAIRALDPHTGEMKWQFKMTDVTDAGVLTTASNLLFSGGREGYFFALNARNGELLWKASLGGGVASGPMSYAVNGKQYIAISAGSSLFVFGLRE